MLKHLIFAHHKPMAVKLLDKYTKNNDVSLYLLDDYNDFSYLVDDLAPRAIIIHIEVWEKESENILRNIEQANHKAEIIILSPNKHPHYKTIIEPFEPGHFLTNLDDLLES